MQAEWEAIDHVVVLMQENLSFDRVLGWTGALGAEGVPTGLGIPVDDPLYPPGTRLHPEPGAALIPPGASHMPWDMDLQLHGGPDGAGFVTSMLRRSAHLPPDARREMVQEALRYHRPDDLPVYRTLAERFAIADRWFAPIASATWPNRYFLHMGTSPTGAAPIPELGGHWPTIFDRLNDAGLSWRIYVDGPATLITSRSVMRGVAEARRRARWAGAPADDVDPVRSIDRFVCDVSRTSAGAWPVGLIRPGGVGDLGVDRLPTYTFIEPRHWPHRERPPNNDHHHTHLHDGQRLVASIYNTLRADPERWARTLLVVTYDEHGGYWDHAAPPDAPDPTTGTPGGGVLGAYGGRVPALLISPRIRPGVYARTCDHTSVLAFLERRFGLAPLSRRDAAADDLTAAFGPEVADTPARIALPDAPPRVARTGDREHDLTSLGLDLYRLLAERTGADADTELRDDDLDTVLARGEARAAHALERLLDGRAIT